jgi:hypothetical protein
VLGRRNAFAEIDDEAGTFRARFGWFTVQTMLTNIERWEISGPYRWFRAIGVRGTIGKPELTYGGSTRGGVGLFFRDPVKTFWIPRLRSFYLTLDDLEGCAAELTRRGIAGEDARSK